MKYRTAADFRKALEQHLRTRSRATGLPVQRFRKEVTFERFLSRLQHVAPELWVLKGGVALDFRLRHHARTTQDIDLGTSATEDEITRIFMAAQDMNLGDHFVFTVERRTPHPIDDLISSVPYRLTAELAGRHFESSVVDVGLNDPLVAAPDVIISPNLLDFADVPPVWLLALPIEQHIAEKVHAYTRHYESGSSSRVKDLVDLILIARYATVEAQDLQHALDVIFRARGTHPLPNSLPHPPAGWKTPYASLARDLAIEPDLTQGFALARDFLAPTLKGTSQNGRVWDPRLLRWGPMP